MSELDPPSVSCLKRRVKWRRISCELEQGRYGKQDKSTGAGDYAHEQEVAESDLTHAEIAYVGIYGSVEDAEADYQLVHRARLLRRA